MIDRSFILFFFLLTVFVIFILVERSLVFIFFLFSTAVFAEIKSDSLLTLLKQNISIPERIEVLTQLSFLKKNTNYHASKMYGNEALQLSLQTNNTKGEALARYRLGLNYWLHAFYKDALDEYYKARSLFLELEQTDRVAAVSNNIGLIYLYMAEYDTSLYYLEKSMKLYTELRDTTNMAILSKNLAIIHERKGDFNQSTEFNLQALKNNLNMRWVRDLVHRKDPHEPIDVNRHIKRRYLLDEFNQFLTGLGWSDSAKVAEVSINIGVLYHLDKVYDSAIFYFKIAEKIFSDIDEPVLLAYRWLDISRSFEGLGRIDSAISYLRKSIPILESDYLYAAADGSYHDLGAMLLKKGDFIEAEHVLKKALLMVDTLGHRASSVKYRNLLTDLKLKTNNPKEALQFALAAWSLANDIKYFDLMMVSAENLYQTYKGLGNNKKALEFKETYFGFYQQKQEAINEQQLGELQISFENELKEQKIAELKRTNISNEQELRNTRYLLALIALFVFVLFIIAMVLVNRIKKVRALTGILKENNLLLDRRNKEKDLLVQEVHHRTKNNLQLVSSILNMQIRRSDNPGTTMALELTQNRVKSIALVHEHLYQKNHVTQVNLRDYVSDLINYIKQSFTFKGKDPEIRLDIERIDIHMDLAIHLGIILNELAINSFKYAFKNKDHPLFSVKATYKFPKLAMEIRDNGLPADDFTPGYGWGIINNTIKSLNGQISVNTENGFVVSFEVEDYLLNENGH